ncbi:hypothetical protein [Halomonas huangheensis]|uniref:DUF4124 domain-containing protein n=1 Tax=Halomonas huangheensis TaxID=1178482 RepID=W1NB84_9GAMM|nr:hypothetical protein [Halomonas huangheensis]ERL52753.1 hypothetical protein BJB45_15855 [Halomonas huangheensis]
MPYPPLTRRCILMLTTSCMPRLMATLLIASSLSACTTYTWDDGHKETVWGVPTEDETLTEQERQAQGAIYREPGEIPEPTQP